MRVLLSSAESGVEPPAGSGRLVGGRGRGRPRRIGADDVNPPTVSAFDLPSVSPSRPTRGSSPTTSSSSQRSRPASSSRSRLSDRLETELRAPGGIGQQALDRDAEIHRLISRLASCAAWPRPVPGADGRRGEPRAGVRRAARPRRRRGPPAAGRLAFPRRRAVLRSDPCQPDGPGEPSPVPLGPRPGSDYLDEVFTADGLSGHAAWTTSPPHRQPRQQRVAPDQTCSPPSRPTRGPSSGPDLRRSARRWRSRPAQDPRRAHRAAYCCTPILASVTAGAACCSSARTSPTWPTSPTCCPASERRGCRPARCATWSPRAPRRRPRPTERGPPEVVGGPGAGDRAGRQVLREPAGQADEGRDALVRIWLSPDDWLEAFEAPEPGTAHNEARERIWEELVAIAIDKFDGDAPASVSAARCCRTVSCARPSTGRGRDRGGPTWLENLVGTGLPQVAVPGWPASATFGRCSARTLKDMYDLRYLTTSGSGWATRGGAAEPGRRQGAARTRAPWRRSSTTWIKAADDEPGVGLVTMLAARTSRTPLVDEGRRLPGADLDVLARAVRAHRRGRGPGTD